MVAARFSDVYDGLMNFLVEKATPQEILAFKPSEEEQARADELAEKNKEGTLTSDEAHELREMLELDAFVAALKLRALEILDPV